MNFININDYQIGDFALGRIWRGKEELIEQMKQWNPDYDENEETIDFYNKMSYWNTKELCDYMSDMWEIEVIPLKDLTKETRKELKGFIHHWE